jgi:hypothetical protein
MTHGHRDERDERDERGDRVDADDVSGPRVTRTSGALIC